MRRRHHYRVDVRRGEVGHDQSVGVDPDWNRLQARHLDGVPLPAPAGILDGHPPCAAAAQDVPEHGQGLRSRAADHDEFGVDDHAAHAGEVLSDRVPELRDAAMIGVSETPSERSRSARTSADFHAARGKRW